MGYKKEIYSRKWNNIISGQKFDYERNDKIIRIVSKQEALLNNQNNVEYEDNTFFEYDEKSNLVQYSGIGDTRFSFIWGYNYNLPIAKIENISYDSIPPALKTKIEELNNFTGDLTTSQIANLKNLNQEISNMVPNNVMITTYTHKPLVGMTSETNPAGITTFYEYNNFDWIFRPMLVLHHFW